MSAHDRDGFPENQKWENWKSKENCKICHETILNGELEASLQDDGSYVCPLCQYDKEKLEKE